MIADMSLRPRIRLRWYILGVVAGMTAAFVTYWWFDGPRWRDRSAGPGHDPHFSSDGNTLTTFHGLEAKPNEEFSPKVVKWDSASGRKLSETPLDWKEPLPLSVERLYVSPVPGDAHSLVGTFLADSSRRLSYYVLDESTGQRISGPINSRYFIQTSSANGRWCSTAEDDFKAIAIVEIDSGKTVFHLTTHDGVVPISSAYSPNGNQVAVHWRPNWRTTGNDRDHFVVIYELPSGREIRRLDLPRRMWQRINDWESDNRLYVEINDPDPSGKGSYFRRSFSFSMGDADFGGERPEPLRAGHVAGKGGRQAYWGTGDGWVAQLTTLEPDEGPPLRKISEWIDQKLRTSLTPKWGDRVRIRMLDAANGSVRCEVPEAVVGCTFSNDARWIASAGDAVEVWSVPPPRQAFWATCAGLATFAVALIVGRFRTRAPSNSAGRLPASAA
jgi:hypothetical protein